MKTNNSLAKTPKLSTLAGHLAAACVARLPLLLLLPAAVQAQFNCTTNNGRITITGYTGSGGALVIPSTINGLPVTSLGDRAFYSCKSLTSVTIGTSVTSIGNSAFAYCNSLTGVTIPNSVTSIGSSAFAGTGLTSVTIPSSVTSIGSSAFSASLSTITVAALNSFYSSVDGVLFNKNQTTLIQYPGGKTGSYTVPGSVTNIGAAFSGCRGLTSATIGNRVTSIGGDAFLHCSGLTNVTIPNSVTSIGTYAFAYCTRLTSVTLPTSVISIGELAFFGSGLTSVTVPANAASIGSSAFSACFDLTSVTIGNGTTSIGSSAFGGCTRLRTITVVALNSFYSSVDGVLFNENLTTLICCPGGRAGSYTVPNSVTSIGTYAFYQCSGLTSVTIPNSVTSIGTYAFAYCSGLTSVTIPNSVTSIGSDAFQSCDSLTSATIGNSTGDRMFNYCTHLTSVTIGPSVTSIGTSAFSGCSGLSSITVDALNSFYSSVDGILFNKNQTALIQSPVGKAGSYTVPSSVASIGSSAFYNCTNLTGVTIGGNVTNIGSSAFYNCTSLTSVSLPNRVTSIGESTFQSCTNLASATLPNSLTSIGTYAFDGCFGLTSVTIPNSVTNIGSSAFSGCSGLSAITVDARNSRYSSIDGILFNQSQTTLIQYPGGKAGSYTVPGSVTNIGDAFSSCTRLTSVILPNGVTSIGSSAFIGCSSLSTITVDALNSFYSSVDGVLFDKGQTTLIHCPGGKTGSYTLPNSVNNIGAGFAYCIRLTSVTIGGGITNIGDGAFNSCTSLTSVTLPNSVVSIGNYVFKGCTSLSAIMVDALNSSYCSVAGVLFNKGQTTLIQYPGGRAGGYTVPGSVISIGAAFSGCTRLTSVTIPNSVTSLGDMAFNGCFGLTSVTIPNSVISIGGLAFQDCTSLTSVTVPNSVTSIGYRAFGLGCSSLIEITVDRINSSYSSVDGVLFNKSQTTLIQYPGGKAGSYIVPNSVVGIQDNAFAYCFGLTSVTTGNSVTRIEMSAFQSCTNLTSVTIPNSVTSIAPDAFWNCTSLAGIFFQGNAPGLGPSAFDGANNATVYYLPGTTGWGPTFGGLATALWHTENPLGCVYGFSSPTAGAAPGAGGIGSFSVATTGVCSWWALASQSWLHTTSSASGNGTVTYFADPNTAPAFRAGTIAVGGQAFTVTQGPAGFVWHNVFGWVFEAGGGWYHHNGFGWMWISPNQWIWSLGLQGWVATMDSTSRTLWSPQFRWLTPSENDPYRADTTAIGAIYLGQYNGAAITDGWVVSGRFGYVWAAGDGMWYYTTTYGWLGVTDAGGIWCVNQGKFL